MGHADMSTTGEQAGPTPLVVMCEEHGKPDTPPATAGRPQGRLRAWRGRGTWENESRPGNRSARGWSNPPAATEATSAGPSTGTEAPKTPSGGRTKVGP